MTRSRWFGVVLVVTTVVAVPLLARTVEPAAPNPDLVQALREALKAESDATTRLLLAKTLIRARPNDTDAAAELVKALTTEGYSNPAEALIVIEDVMAGAPPALVTALLPVLKDRDATNRRRAAAALAKLRFKTSP